MVMHARKTQRMSDGYFEKHQTHPYQNSKYGSSKNYGSSSERYDRIRDSPNGNYRSDSPDSQSPRDRDRSYQSKNSYLQKIREKERENRDYKVSRDKYSDSVRSPKEKRSRDSEHRTNHDRSDDKSILHPIKSQNLSSRDGRKLIHNNCVDKAHQREDRERVARVGDWSEHLSSSGKKYYYNCKTEVSQWEKPREWIERERERDRFRNRDRERDSDRSYGSSSRSGHDKHSNSRPSNSKDGTRESGRHWSSSTRDDDIPSKDVRSSSSRKQSEENAQQSTQDMDISPGDSTPTSETSYRPPECAGDPSLATGPVLLANALPRLVSHPPLGGGGGRPPDVSPILNTPGTPSASVAAPCSTVTTSNAPGPPVSRMSSTEVVDGKLQALSVETNHAGGTGEGPPTPTHSEVADGVKVATVATPSGSPPNSTSGPATSSGLSSLQGVSSSLQALRPQGPSITPSLANHYRDDLVNHVRGWPADILEKQAQKCSEEAHILGSIQCSKVSAELKCARSLVRLTEIQARLQEQRILFLRQQIKTLEELKSQNSFMSDDY